MEGVSFTVMVTSELEAVQGALLIVQRSTYVPAPPAGVKVAVGLVVLLNWLDEVLGPLYADHAPAPTLGLFAAKTWLPVLQMVSSVPALAVVGVWLILTVTASLSPLSQSLIV